MNINQLGEEENIQEDDPIREAEYIGNRPSFSIPEFLKAKSPDKPIEDYLNHPLNFNNSMGAGQAIRGLEGMFDSLNYAAVDVIIGIMKMKKVKNEPVN